MFHGGGGFSHYLLAFISLNTGFFLEPGPITLPDLSFSQRQHVQSGLDGILCQFPLNLNQNRLKFPPSHPDGHCHRNFNFPLLRIQAGLLLFMELEVIISKKGVTTDFSFTPILSPAPI